MEDLTFLDFCFVLKNFSAKKVLKNISIENCGPYASAPKCHKILKRSMSRFRISTDKKIGSEKFSKNSHAP